MSISNLTITGQGTPGVFTDPTKQTVTQKAVGFINIGTDGYSNSIINPFTPFEENLAIWYIIAMLVKNNPDKATMLIKTLIEESAGVLDSFVRAGSSNRISAYASAQAYAQWCERFGIMTRNQALDYMAGLKIITGVEVAEEFTSIIPWKALAPDADFPSTITLGDGKRVTKVQYGFPERKGKKKKKEETEDSED